MYARLLVLTLIAGLDAGAATVFVQGKSSGQGFSRARGPECFVVTAGHVASSEKTNVVVGQGGARGAAELERILPGDVAILRVTGPNSALCPSSDKWGAKTHVPPNNYREKVLEYSDESGAIRSIPLSVEFDPHQLEIKSGDAQHPLQQGMSGAPVFGDGQLIGLLLAVKGQVGTAARIVYLEGILEPIFGFDKAPPELSVAELQRIDENLAVAKVAMEKRDCAVALQSLLAVPDKRRENALWTLYAARAYECLKRNQEALDAYRKYDELIPGQKAILETMAKLGYEIRAGQVVGQIKESIAGYWALGSGNAILVTQAADGAVEGYYAFVDSSNREFYRDRGIGDPTLRGTYKQGVFTGLMYSRFADSDTDRCEGLSRWPFPNPATLAISADGKVLAGEEQTIEVDGCSKRSVTRPVRITRLNSDGTDAFGERKVRASPEQILAAAKIRTQQIPTRANLAGVWRNSSTGKLKVELEGTSIKGVLTEVVAGISRSLMYQAGSTLFQGTWENGAFSGKILAAWDRWLPQGCQFTPPLEEQGRLTVSEDGTVLTVKVDVKRVNQECQPEGTRRTDEWIFFR